jgi:hypothetical protein
VLFHVPGVVVFNKDRTILTYLTLRLHKYINGPSAFRRFCVQTSRPALGLITLTFLGVGRPSKHLGLCPANVVHFRKVKGMSGLN